MKIYGVKCPYCYDIIYSRCKEDRVVCRCREVFVEGGQNSDCIRSHIDAQPVEFELDTTIQQLYGCWFNEISEGVQVEYDGHHVCGTYKIVDFEKIDEPEDEKTDLPQPKPKTVTFEDMWETVEAVVDLYGNPEEQECCMHLHNKMNELMTS